MGWRREKSEVKGARGALVWNKIDIESHPRTRWLVVLVKDGGRSGERESSGKRGSERGAVNTGAEPSLF